MLDDLKVPSLSRWQKMLKVRFFFFFPGKKACIRKKAKNAMIQTFGKTSKDQKVRVLNPKRQTVCFTGLRLKRASRKLKGIAPQPFTEGGHPTERFILKRTVHVTLA